MPPRVGGHLAMLAFSLLIAGSFSLGARVAGLIDPVALTALRFWLAAGVVGVVVLAQGGVPRAAWVAPWRWPVLGGLYAIYFVLMFKGLETAPPVSAAAVFTLTPLMAAGFGWLLLRQRLTGRMVLALVIGGAGALWVVFRGDPARLLALQVGQGEAIYAVGCVAHALYTPLFRRTSRGERLAVAALATSVCGGALLTIWGWGAIRATDWAALPTIVWVTLAYTAVMATAASMVLMQAASLRLPAAKVMAYTYLTPSWVIGWETGFGNPPPGIVVLAGVGLTLAALALLLRDEPQAG